jgi:hypothetical protein
MKQQNIGLGEFLTWFSDQEDIPLNVRIDFLEHVKKEGKIDEKAISFVDQYLNKKDSEFNKKLSQLSDELVFVRSQLALEQNPKLSNKTRIQASLKKTLNRLTSSFKTKWISFDKKYTQSQESAEELENAAQIARLKAAL